MKIRSKPKIAISRDAVRHAFSYLEKATATSASAHLDRARDLLDGIRTQMEQEIVAAGEELQSALRDQAGLAARRIWPAAANERSRELAAKIEQLRMRIKDFNVLLAARRSADLGEFVDLPIEDYQPRIAPPHRPSAHKRGGILSALIVDEPTLAGIQLKPTRLGLIVWGVVLLVAFAASLGYLGLVRLGGTLALELASAGGPQRLIVVTILNNSNEPIEIRMPLPEGGVSSNEDGAGTRVCGLRAWMRGDAGKEFRLVPTSTDCWVQQNQKLDEPPPLTVPARLAAQVLFDPGKLGNCRSLRIALVRSDGSVLVQRDIDLK